MIWRPQVDRESSTRPCPSGVRIMATSTRWSRSPVTRPDQSPSIIKHEFTTLVTNNNFVPDCWGTTIETQVFLETEASQPL
jgi:hypothetical protein